MFSITSFLIGAFVSGLLVYVNMKNCKCQEREQTPFEKKLRKAGSRKEDEGVFVEERVKRQVYTDGKHRYRKTDIDSKRA